MTESAPIPVLIVDDDPTAAAVLKALLRGLTGELACRSAWAATGAAALAEIQRQPPQLVLLDYLLPDTDGLGLLARINELPDGERPVVIMLTGSGNEHVAVEAMKLGAKDYIVKGGLDLPGLKRAIMAALDRHRLEARLAQSTAELRRKNAQLDADLTMAREVQQALLPQQLPVFPPGVAPADSALRFHHRWIPDDKVAGDFFAVLPLTDTSAGVFLCDVMGHGVRAALVTALLHGLVREHRALAEEPERFLGELNRALKAILERTQELVFVTAVYAVVDTARAEIRLANAGHPPPFLLARAAGRAVPLASPDGPGPALGLIPDFAYEATRHAVATGDGLLVYTDGVYEAADAAGEEFGRERLRATAEKQLAGPPAQLLDGLLAAVRAHQPAGHPGGFGDDVCLVAVEIGRAG